MQDFGNCARDSVKRSPSTDFWDFFQIILRRSCPIDQRAICIAPAIAAPRRNSNCVRRGPDLPPISQPLITGVSRFCDPRLRRTFLPRAYETDSFRLNAEGLDGIDDLFTEVA